MNVGTVLFTYHRSEHTRSVIEALSKNEILPKKLYIFQDGIKDNTNISEWKKVNRLINNINFCETQVHVSRENRGLSKSIVSGINYVLEECDAVIVLEDDCVPHKQFMRFMLEALNKYENNNKVYSVSGYAWDVDLQYNSEDAYFNQKFSSWGWGTWKDRWEKYEEDYHVLSEIKKNPEAEQRLNIWGKTMESMLVGNVLSKNDSWAVFWGLTIIKKDGYCLSPYKQLVYNIGFDGSGVHCSELQNNYENWESEDKKIFNLPNDIKYTKDCENEFRFLFGGKQGEEKLKLYQELLLNWIQFKQKGKYIKIPYEWSDGIAVWGKGKIFDVFVNEICDIVKVKYIIESRPSIKEYRGIPIIPVRKLPKDITNIVIIPYFDLDIIKEKLEKIKKNINLWGINELIK